MPPSKTLPRFYHYLPGRRELPIPPEQLFLKIFFLEEKGGENYRVERITKIAKGIGHKF